MLLDGYAYSTAHLARNLAAANHEPEQSAAVGKFLQPLLRERGFPTLASIMSAGAYGDGAGVTNTEVDFGLDRILDGIEVLISAGPSSQDPV
jgi:hypothetical protein